MKTLSSGEAQKNFGALVDFATTGEGVRVTRYGRPGVLVLPDNELTHEIVRKLAGRRLISKLKLRSNSPNFAPAQLTQDDVNRLIDECFV